jgi:hypothetical protein
MEVMKCLKPSGKRATRRWQRVCAGRNASERSASLEIDDARADPTTLSGKAEITGWMSDAVPPVAVPGLQRWLGELALALRNEEYRPDPIRRAFIPKANGTQAAGHLDPAR